MDEEHLIECLIEGLSETHSHETPLQVGPAELHLIQAIALLHS